MSRQTFHTCASQQGSLATQVSTALALPCVYSPIGLQCTRSPVPRIRYGIAPRRHFVWRVRPALLVSLPSPMLRQIRPCDITRAPTMSDKLTRDVQKTSLSFSQKLDSFSLSQWNVSWPCCDSITLMFSTRARQHYLRVFSCHLCTPLSDPNIGEHAMISKTSAVDALGQRNKLCRNTKKKLLFAAIASPASPTIMNLQTHISRMT